MVRPNSKRRRFDILEAQMENERASFLSHWRDLAEIYMPTRPRFTVTDKNKGWRKNLKIIDETTFLAARTLRSGMMSGLTSPARPWLRLTTPDPQLAEFGPVKSWLGEVNRLMNSVFLKSNLYQVLPIIYGDVGVFGTAAMIVEEDIDDVIRCEAVPIGSYMIATDRKGIVNTFIREIEMTVGTLVEKFGYDTPEDRANNKINWDRFSLRVKDDYDNDRWETQIEVNHIVAPNPNYDPKKLGSKFKKFESAYYEKSAKDTTGQHPSNSADQEKFLRESGFDKFRVLCPRWETTGNDVYATSCPGMVSIGGGKSLMLMHKRKHQAIEHKVKPPMIGPASMRKKSSSILPGDITYLDEREGTKGFRPAFEINFDIRELKEEIFETQTRIKEAFFKDLFKAFIDSDRRQITATEIDARKEEKLVELGPMLEQTNQDLLNPLVELTFDGMVEQNMIPTPPEELAGTDLKIEYISIMAQAQKSIGLSGLERFTRYVTDLAAQTQDPKVLMKFNSLQAVDEYGEGSGVSTRVINSDEEVEEQMFILQQAEEARVRQEQMAQASQTAKNLSETSLEGDSALSALVDQAQAGDIAGIQ